MARAVGAGPRGLAIAAALLGALLVALGLSAPASAHHLPASVEVQLVAAQGIPAPDLYPVLPIVGATGPPPIFIDFVTKPGETLFRFDTVIANSGGTLDLFCTDCTTPGAASVYQILWPTGEPSSAPHPDVQPSTTDALDLTFGGADLYYEPAMGHVHWHYRRAALYELIVPGKPPIVDAKVGFCMLDTYNTEGKTLYFSDPPAGSSTTWCAPAQASRPYVRMGISPGVGDYYSAQLTDQWVTVTDVAPGVYTLRATVNPDHVIMEGDAGTWANNTLEVLRTIPGVVVPAPSVVTAPGQMAALTLTGSVIGPGIDALSVEVFAQCANPLVGVLLGSCYVTADPSTLAFAITAWPANGTVQITGVTGTTASVTYTPNAGFEGTDTFTYTATAYAKEWPGKDYAWMTSEPTTVTISVGTPPANVAAPTVSGPPQVGQTLSAAPGGWTGGGPFSFAYQWQQCSAGGSGCADVAGATGGFYVPSSIDEGHSVRVMVTATGVAGVGLAASATLGPVRALPMVEPPEELDPPTASSRRIAINGTRKRDRLIGTPADEKLRGRRGADLIRAKGGADVVIAGRGADRIWGGGGSDKLRGGRGNDRIVSRDGEVDVIACGPGRKDVVIGDRIDDIDGSCETVRLV